MRLIACSDGASGELSATLCSSPTTSSCGTRTFVSAATASQNSTIGTESQRIVCAMRCGNDSA